MAANTATAPAQDRRAELLAKLDTALADVLSSDGYRQYLDCQAKFHGYSFANCMLIAMQCRQASRVAGYRTWQELGRNVRRGEHAIWIWAPSRYRVKPKAGVAADKSAPASGDGDGDKVDTAGETEYRLGFVPVPVFDISQTDGAELPELAWRSAAQSDSALIYALNSAAQALGFRTELGADIDSDGLCIHQPEDGGVKLLKIRAGLGSAQTARALAHETAHALLHGETADGIARDKACRELEADSVAYVVLAHFDLDCAAPVASYLALYQGKQAREVLKAVAGRVQSAAAKIIAQVETALTPYGQRAQLTEARRAA